MSRVLLTRVAHRESKLLIWLQLSARLVNRDKDLVATTDAHHRPVRVHTQRPGKGLQTKQGESLRAQDSAIQEPDQNRNYMILWTLSTMCTYTVTVRVQELCESRGGRPGFSVLTSLTLLSACIKGLQHVTGMRVNTRYINFTRGTTSKCR